MKDARKLVPGRGRGDSEFPCLLLCADWILLCAGITENKDRNTAHSHTYTSPECGRERGPCGHPGSVPVRRSAGWHIQRDAAVLGQSSQLLSSPRLALRLSCHRPWAEWLSITPGSLHGFPPQRGFSFSPAAIFRGLGSTDMPPSNDPVAQPGWGPWPPTQRLRSPPGGHYGGPGSSLLTAETPGSLSVWLGWQEPAQARCSVCFLQRGESWGWVPETPLPARMSEGSLASFSDANSPWVTAASGCQQ